MKTNEATDKVLVQMVPQSADRLCNHRHPYTRPVVALISVTLNGRTSAWGACSQDVSWYTDQIVVNDAGQPVPVEVR